MCTLHLTPVLARAKDSWRGMALGASNLPTQSVWQEEYCGCLWPLPFHSFGVAWPSCYWTFLGALGRVLLKAAALADPLAELG